MFVPADTVTCPWYPLDAAYGAGPAVPLSEGESVLVQRNDGLFELDAATGEPVWHEPNLGAGEIQWADAKTFLLWHNGAIERRFR